MFGNTGGRCCVSYRTPRRRRYRHTTERPVQPLPNIVKRFYPARSEVVERAQISRYTRPYQ